VKIGEFTRVNERLQRHRGTVGGHRQRNELEVLVRLARSRGDTAVVEGQGVVLGQAGKEGGEVGNGEILLRRQTWVPSRGPT
jgi:hypothetical protein